MQITLKPDSSTPLFQQLADQVHFLINTGALQPADKLPSIRSIASEHQLATNTVVKAFRQLEFSGLIASKDRSGYHVTQQQQSNRYKARGVSTDKSEVHNVVDKLDPGIYPNAFCKIEQYSFWKDSWGLLRSSTSTFLSCQFSPGPIANGAA